METLCSVFPTLCCHLAAARVQCDSEANRGGRRLLTSSRWLLSDCGAERRRGSGPGSVSSRLGSNRFVRSILPSCERFYPQRIRFDVTLTHEANC